jgi:hypothetical protein
LPLRRPEEGTACVPDREGAWRDIPCVVEECVVGNDNTVAWVAAVCSCRRACGPHFVRAKVHALATAGRVWHCASETPCAGFRAVRQYWTQSKTIFAKSARQSPLPPSGRPSEGGCLRSAAPTATGSLKITMQFQSHRCSQFHPVRCAIQAFKHLILLTFLPYTWEAGRKAYKIPYRSAKAAPSLRRFADTSGRNERLVLRGSDSREPRSVILSSC